MDVTKALRAAMAALLFPAIALASGSNHPPPGFTGRAPEVDLSGVPASASVRATNPDGQPHQVHARLLADHLAVRPGDTIRLGVLLDQDRDWHTYWRSFGDIGLPTEVTWSLPDGLTAAPHRFPVPTRFDQDGLVSFGFEDRVMLTSEVTVADTVAPGSYTVGASVSWLVCKTSCIPGSAELSLPIEVREAPRPSPWRSLFEHTATRQPVAPESLENVKVHAALSASAIKPDAPFRFALHLTPTEGHRISPPGSDPWPTFAAIRESYDWEVTGTRVVADGEGGVLITVDAMAYEPDPLPTGATIGGLIQVEVDGHWERAEVLVPMPWVTADGAVTPSDDPIWKLTATGAAEPPEDEDEVEHAAAPPPSAPPAAGAGDGAAAFLDASLLAANLFAAFVGGLLLNIMPCVLPVLTLKLYGLVEQIDITHAEKRKAGLAYTGGILASFWALAAAALVFRSVFGFDVGWGFQFQYPEYVAGLATIVFLFGLSLFGVFELPAFGTGSAAELSSREGVGGYFFTGVFATLVATPCSAPFLGTAVAFAFQAPAPLLVLVLSLVGLGLAAPFLLIAFVPALYRFLPRPGAWMEAFKQLLGFSLMATTLWLLDVLVAQIGADRTIGFLVFLLFAAIGAWIFGRWGGLDATPGRQLGAAAIGVLVAFGGGGSSLDLELAEPDTCDDGTVATDLSFAEEIPWQAFSETRVAALSGQPILVDFTAEWCVTCKFNERTILDQPAVREAMATHRVVPLKADWTRKDPVITTWLQQRGRAGVPMYVLIAPSGEEVLLPEVITQDMVIEAIRGLSSQG